MRFGVNSPEPDTSKQSAPAMQPSTSIARDVPAEQEPQPSPRKPTVVKYEPPSFNLQIPKKMLTRAERDQVLQNHMAAANAAFTKVAVLEDLMRQEPHNAAHYKEVQRIQRNQYIQVAIKLQHMLEADNEFRHTASVRPARTFVDSEEHGHSPRQGATLHGDIYGSQSITPTAKR